MNRIGALLRKYREQILYVVFGAGTTLVNVAAYWLLRRAGLPTAASVTAAWIASVVFAFVTNKLFVFESRSWRPGTVLREALSFFSCRVLTYFLDLGIMVLFVDVLRFPDLPVKIASNVIVIVLNYVASKLLIFRKKKAPETEAGEGNGEE